MAVARVRTATAGDVAVLTALHATTWRFAYRELLGPEILDELDSPEFQRAWAEAISGEATVLVATEGPEPVGFVVAGRAPHREVATADGSLPTDADHIMLVSSLLVEPRWGRRGHGGRLLTAAAAAHRDTGATRGITWAPVEDPVTLNFYRRVGWDPDGTLRTLDAGGRAIREMRLTGSLDLRLSP